MREKFKDIVSDDAFFYSILLVLVGIIAFGLGRNSMDRAEVVATPSAASPRVETYKNAIALPLLTTATDQETAVANALTSTDVANEPDRAAAPAVIASKNGTKYHLPTCAGAKQIKEANLIRFASIEQARAAGYEPAKNCEF